METFDFPYHTVETQNPESGFRLQLGGSYVFSSPSPDPDQRTFVLSFPLLKFFMSDDGTIDADTHPQINMMRLINFYHTHKMHKTFKYDHPVHGLLEVQFQKPLPEPDGVKGGHGVTKDFTVQLLEIP